ncbi:MAG: hypothetical protein WCJ63_06715, partial [Actinomycetes bacterium]
MTVRHRSLKPDQLEFLRSDILVGTPDVGGLDKRLEAALAPGVGVIEFADFGTVGLAGPTRADHTFEADCPRNFADFVLNIGRPQGKPDGAGTYGYGKASFYLASTVGTVVVDSVCEVEPGVMERRLLACALAREFDAGGERYTGRHWWIGIDGDHEGVVPLFDDRADEAAEQLGLPHRSRTIQERGTTVAVVSPDIEDFTGSPVSPAAFVANAIAWNFWPKMITTDRLKVPGIDFRVFDGDEEIHIPNPLGPNRIRPFALAKQLLDAESPQVGGATGCSLTPILHNATDLGVLALLVTPMTDGSGELPEGEEAPEPFGSRATQAGTHHVALMRNEELVVTYSQQRQPAKEGLGIAGVFRCDPNVEVAFALAEPPTHDSWAPDFVPSRCEDPAEGKRYK